MSCVGIFMDTHTRRALFNHALVLQRGKVLTDYHAKLEAPLLRDKLEQELRKTAPHVSVKCFDAYTELECEMPPEGDYIFVLVQEAPIYSGSMH